MEAVEAVLGAEVYLYHFKVVMKDAGTFGNGERGDNGWQWHQARPPLHHTHPPPRPHAPTPTFWVQDWGYWYNDSNRIFPNMASISIALDPATTANGCLELLKGSHRLGRLAHARRDGEQCADPERVALAQQSVSTPFLANT